MRHASRDSLGTISRLVGTGILLLLGALLPSRQPTSGASGDFDTSTGAQQVSVAVIDATEYLRNGGLNGDYYWRYPNHFVAPEWLRFWTVGTEGIVLPEYIHDSYYTLEGGRSQRWHRLPQAYAGGIYQVVDVIPCALYELSAWTRQNATDGAVAHSKLGFDPTGQQLTSEPSGGTSDLIGFEFPAQTAWSPEQNVLGRWDRLSVVAEAAGSKVTAIMFSAPERGSTSGTPYYSTYWDAGSMVQVPFHDNLLPEPWAPSDFIYNSVTPLYDAGTLTVTWETSAPASSQLVYEVTPAPITVTVPTSNTVYFPLIAGTRQYPLDLAPVTQHAMRITGLKVGDVVDYIVLSRRVDGIVCKTETSGWLQVTIGAPGVVLASPRGESGVIANSAAVP
ncbi:MAG: hypothetical protein ACYCYF_11165 [Anaerolineae bacterium]